MSNSISVSYPSVVTILCTPLIPFLEMRTFMFKVVYSRQYTSCHHKRFVSVITTKVFTNHQSKMKGKQGMKKGNMTSSLRQPLTDKRLPPELGPTLLPTWPPWGASLTLPARCRVTSAGRWWWNVRCRCCRGLGDLLVTSGWLRRQPGVCPLVAGKKLKD